MASLGAERSLTANLTSATLFIGAGAAVGVVSILASFQVLAAIYLPSALTLFGILTACGAVVAVVFVALSLGDAWVAGPLDIAWRRKQWLGTQPKSLRWAGVAAGLASIPPVLGGVLYFSGAHVSVSQTTVHTIVGIGLGLTVLNAIGGVVRTMFGQEQGVQRREAVASLAPLSFFMFALLICLP
jgi:hypothetical protein